MYPCFALYCSIILSPIPAGPVDEPQTLPIEREVLLGDAAENASYFKPRWVVKYGISHQAVAVKKIDTFNLSVVVAFLLII